jgi:hypothetical protein
MPGLMVKYHLNRVIARKVMYMQTNDFEQAFGDFLDRREYDQAENALFAMVRIAFLAGWKAAGGNPPQPQKIFQIVHKKDISESAIETDISLKK